MAAVLGHRPTERDLAAPGRRARGHRRQDGRDDLHGDPGHADRRRPVVSPRFPRRPQHHPPPPGPGCGPRRHRRRPYRSRSHLRRHLRAGLHHRACGRCARHRPPRHRDARQAPRRRHRGGRRRPAGRRRDHGRRLVPADGDRCPAPGDTVLPRGLSLPVRHQLPLVDDPRARGGRRHRRTAQPLQGCVAVGPVHGRRAGDHRHGARRRMALGHRPAPDPRCRPGRGHAPVDQARPYP